MKKLLSLLLVLAAFNLNSSPKQKDDQAKKKKVVVETNNDAAQSSPTAQSPVTQTSPVTPTALVQPDENNSNGAPHEQAAESPKLDHDAAIETPELPTDAQSELQPLFQTEDADKEDGDSPQAPEVAGSSQKFENRDLTWADYIYTEGFPIANVDGETALTAHEEIALPKHDKIENAADNNDTSSLEEQAVKDQKISAAAKKIQHLFRKKLNFQVKDKKNPTEPEPEVEKVKAEEEAGVPKSPVTEAQEEPNHTLRNALIFAGVVVTALTAYAKRVTIASWFNRSAPADEPATNDTQDAAPVEPVVDDSTAAASAPVENSDVTPVA